MATDPRVQCWWELGDWPVKSAGEILSAFFEDLRKRMVLLFNPQTGFIDLGTAYDINSWSGNWSGYAEPTPARAGDITVLFRDAAGNEDLYINNSDMNEGDIEARPPVRPDLMIEIGWRLAPNPNRYRHRDHNAGKPAAGAEGRWEIEYFAAVPTCGHDDYTFRGEAYRRFARQVDPYRQIPPIKYLSTGRILERHQGVELERRLILQNLATTHARSLDTTGYEKCKKPRRLSEYIIEHGHANTLGCESAGGECSESGQCAWDPKINEAYQDQVIRTAERSAHYLKPVDDEWIANYIWARPKSLWTLTTYYIKGVVAYKTSIDDTVQYYCIKAHTAAAGNEPGVGGSWETYWTTPVYNAEYARDQPVYVEFAWNPSTQPESCYSWFWGCNDSAYELLLKHLGGDESVHQAWDVDYGRYAVDTIVQFGDICKRCKVAHDSAEDKDPTNGAYWGAVTQFDWWWDTTFPAVPQWLYMNQYDADPADWPLPRGCWRRTWKHSPGRVGARMWPGERGDPPGYEPVKIIVTAAQYNAAVLAGNEKWYAVSDVENLHDAAYGDEEEALIAKRHDPVHIRYIEYFNEVTRRTETAAHPIYEAHHDAINDMRNVLLQIHRVDDTGLNITAKYRTWQCDDTIESLSSLGAYGQGRGSAMEERSTPSDNPFIGTFGSYLDEWWEYGYQVVIDHSTAWPGPNIFSSGEGGVQKNEWYLDITKDPTLTQALDISTAIVRIAYKGSTSAPPGDEKVHEGCQIGFEDLTVTAEPLDPTEKNLYVRLPIDGGSSTESWFFTATVLDPWPATGPGEFFDFTNSPYYEKGYHRLTRMAVNGVNMHRWIILCYDWDKIPEDVFEDDLTNAIEVPVP